MALNAPCARCATMLDLPPLGPGALLRCGRCDAVNQLTSLADGRMVLTLSPTYESPPPPRHAPPPHQNPREQVFQAPYPGQPPYTPGPHQERPPSSNLVLGILAAVVGCVPLGIVSIVYATKVDSAWFSGDHLAARRYSDAARNWGIFGLLFQVITFVLFFFFFVAAAPAAVHLSR